MTLTVVRPWTAALVTALGPTPHTVPHITSPTPPSSTTNAPSEEPRSHSRSFASGRWPW